MTISSSQHSTLIFSIAVASYMLGINR